MNTAQIFMIQQMTSRAGKSNMVGGGSTDPENNGKYVAVAILGLLTVVVLCKMYLLNH